MINMSYCMFHNTLLAMRECAQKMEDIDGDISSLSEAEKEAAKKLMKVCGNFAEWKDVVK